MFSFLKLKSFRNWPIKGKITGVVLLANITALLITLAAFIAYDLATFKQNLARNLSVISSLVAENSSAAVGYEYEQDARDMLASLKANPDVIRAAFYDRRGRFFVGYPEDVPATEFPARPGELGAFFAMGFLVVFQ